MKQCSIDECTNHVQRGGVCKRHGAYHNPQDESTAFAPSPRRLAHDDTTASILNNRTA